MNALARTADELAEYLHATRAPELARAVQQRDPAKVNEIVTSMPLSDLYALVVVLASEWPLPPSPLIRAEDGIFDEITVARVAGGTPLPLTVAERNAVIRLMRRRGVTVREIAEYLGLSKSQVAKVAKKAAPVQTELLTKGVIA